MLLELNVKGFKEKSWKFYDAWRKMGSYCPALKTSVRISLLGWKHLTGVTGSKKRKISDVYRRLKLLPEARWVIENSNTVQNVLVRNNTKYYVLESFRKGRQIRVIIAANAWAGALGATKTLIGYGFGYGFGRLMP